MAPSNKTDEFTLPEKGHASCGSRLAPRHDADSLLIQVEQRNDQDAIDQDHRRGRDAPIAHPEKNHNRQRRDAGPPGSRIGHIQVAQQLDKLLDGAPAPAGTPRAWAPG